MATSPRGKPRKRAGITQPSILLAFDWFDERIYKGVFRYAKEHGWHLSSYLISDRFVPRLWPGDGAITCYGPNLATFIDSLAMPTVDITIEPMARKVPRVHVDNARIGVLAADHFHQRGFQHYAFYSWRQVRVNRVRREAFFGELRARGVPEDHLHDLEQSPDEMLGDWDQHQSDIHAKLARLPRPLAVFAGQDNLGANLIEICVRNGIHVPEEIAVLGVDNIELLCEGAVVPMSSVRTNLAEVGYQAAARLDALMRGTLGRDAPPVIVPPVGVVGRLSTDVLAVPHPGVVSAVRYIRGNFGRPITIDDICAYTGMSKRGLEKAFLRHLGRTPATELRHLRLNQAKKLLTETDQKIEAIATDCGYSNSSNLSCAFRRDTGLSPRAYRKRFGGPRDTPDVAT